MALLVVVRVVDYAEAVAVMEFAMTQSALTSATRGAGLPDLEYVPDSVVYTQGGVPEGSTPGGTTPAESKSGALRGGTGAALVLSASVLLLVC